MGRPKGTGKPVAERAMAKSIWVDGCLVWQGCKSKKGYGQTSWYNEELDKHQTREIHRILWIEVNGDPGDLLVLHTCNNPSCVNLDHLYLGTQSDNELDKVEAGTSTYQLIGWEATFKRDRSS